MHQPERHPQASTHRSFDMPAPIIPLRRTPWFMRALWVLAALLVVGLAYSFWRISRVASPTLDVPPTDTSATPIPGR